MLYVNTRFYAQSANKSAAPDGYKKNHSVVQVIQLMDRFCSPKEINAI